MRDESLEDTADLPDPDVLAAETVEDLQAGDPEGVPFSGLSSALVEVHLE